MGPQTELMIFLKLLPTFGMEIDYLDKLNKYLQFELLSNYEFKCFSSEICLQILQGVL